MECSCPYLEYKAVFFPLLPHPCSVRFSVFELQIDVYMWCIISADICPLYYLYKIALFHDSSSAEKFSLVNFCLTRLFLGFSVKIVWDVKVWWDFIPC